jgi:branched-chain amino acid transport system ATP-binding protein
VLVVSGVSKRFGGVTALTDISLSVEEGEIVGVMGPNGAGKSTLFGLVTGFVRPDAGTVSFQGKDVTGLAPETIADRGLVRTFQNCTPFPEMTVEDNVLVGALRSRRTREAAKAHAREVAELVGLDAERTALGRDIGVPQRKRLELARALATDPKMILCDELMGGLTPSEQNELAVIFAAIRDRGVTLLVVEHAVFVLASVVDRLVAFADGCVLDQDEPAAILANPKVVDSYFGEAQVSRG